jgi:hypothetical protein
MDDAPGGAEPAELTLIAETDARRALAARALTFTVLVPPFPAFGVGTLRVLRVLERPGAADIIAGYDRYERRDDAPRRA